MGTGIQLPKKKNIICTIKDSSKEEFLPIAKQYYMFGYDLYATEGTYKFLKEHDVPVHFVNRICEKNKYKSLDLNVYGYSRFSYRYSNKK